MRLRPTLTVYGVGGFVGGAEGEVGEDEAVDVDPLFLRFVSTDISQIFRYFLTRIIPRIIHVYHTPK